MMQKPLTARSDYYSALDGFRGLLALVVAAYHTIWISHPQTWPFFGNGPVIIDLFFALSGFLMWRLYSHNLDTGAQLGSFMKRRFARLYPLHLFMLLGFTAFAVLRLVAHKVGIAETSPGEILPFEAGAVEGWASLLQNLTLTHAFGLSESLTFNPPSWTIGAEFWTYLVFASVMLFCRPKHWTHFAIITASIAAIYIYLSTVKPDMNISYDYGFWRCLAGFFSGVLAAAAFEKIRAKASKLSRSGFTALEVLMVVGSTLFIIYCGGKGQFFVGPVVFLFVLIFAFDGGAVSKFMSHRVFSYLAKISYSVYMIHVLISIAFAIMLEQLFGGLPTGWVADGWLLIYLCIVIAASHFTQKYVEVPGGKFIRKLQWPQKRLAKVKPSV